MFEKRAAGDRGVTRLFWLESLHTFSYGEFYDPDYPKYRDLRVLNHETIAPAQGVEAPHRNMEILHYIANGQLEHRDSLGNVRRLGRHGVQHISAGSGVTHSEINPSEKEPLELIQIWILPAEKKTPPKYQGKVYPILEQSGEFVLLASPIGSNGSLAIGQDVSIYAAIVEGGSRISFALDGNRHGWVQILSGAVRLDTLALEKGDGVKVADERIINFEAKETSEILLFDLK